MIKEYDDNDLLTAVEAAMYLRRSVHTIARWRREGRGPAYQGGGKGTPVTYRVADIEAFIEADTKIPGEGQ